MALSCPLSLLGHNSSTKELKIFHPLSFLQQLVSSPAVCSFLSFVILCLDLFKCVSSFPPPPSPRSRTFFLCLTPLPDVRLSFSFPHCPSFTLSPSALLILYHPDFLLYLLLSLLHLLPSTFPAPFSAHSIIYFSLFLLLSLLSFLYSLPCLPAFLFLLLQLRRLPSLPLLTPSPSFPLPLFRLAPAPSSLPGCRSH